MAEIIKFPTLRFCSDCARPLDPDEGVSCATKGCDEVLCDYCESVSHKCVEHMKEEIRAERLAQGS